MSEPTDTEPMDTEPKPEPKPKPDPNPSPQQIDDDQPNPDNDGGAPLAPTTTTASTLSHSGADSSDSDSDSDSDDDDAHLASLLQTLESKLSTNPSDYDSHVQYIGVLRKMGEIDKLRQAREMMSQIFPLTPSMWQEWAKDETSLSSGPEAVSAIEKIYERGVSEYLSVPLWCDYLSFVQEHDPSIRECSSVGLSKARDLFERALTAAGLHFSEGSKIWEAYKEFEQAICLTMDESDVEAKEKQIQRIRSIFVRQLSVPLDDMQSSLLAYKVWEVEQGNDLDVNSSDLSGLSSNVASAYKKALEMYNARSSLEEQVSNVNMPDVERLTCFKKYLKFEESSGNPARIQILYERAITEFPISDDLWRDYTHYLDKTLKVGKVLKDAIIRATRNCPWVGELWVRCLLCLERIHASEEDVSQVFEKALQCTFTSFEEYLDLFLTRIDGLRRRISATGEMQVLDYAVIRDTFQRASDYLSQNLKGTAHLLRLHAYWARLEINLAKDIVAARGVWESLLKISGTMLEAWQSYIQMEIENGNLNEARSIYRRCYTKRFPGSGSEEICRLWLQFEREFGTLEDYDYVVQKVSPRLKELHEFRLQQEMKTSFTSAEVKEHPSKKNASGKRKPSSTLSEDQSPSKRLKDMGKSNKKVTRRDHDKGQNNTRETEVNLDKPDGGYEPKKKDSSRDKVMYTDQCTAFISNLDLKANYEHIRNFFSDVGGVQSIRILKDKYTGKSRGLAYVDFCDDAHLDAAVAKNRRTLLGKKLSIARSDPTKSKKQGPRETHNAKEGEKIPSGDQERPKRDDSTKDKSSKESADLSSSGEKLVIDNIQLKGKNTFAVPRNVKPLGWIPNRPNNVKGEGEKQDEKPKSNDEFREMLLLKK